MGTRNSAIVEINVTEIPNTDENDVNSVKDSLSFDNIKGWNSSSSKVTSDLNLISVKDGVKLS